MGFKGEILKLLFGDFASLKKIEISAFSNELRYAVFRSPF